MKTSSASELPLAGFLKAMARQLYDPAQPYPPRFDENVKTIQVDIHGEEIGRNVPAEVGLVGDIKAVVGQLNEALEADPYTFAADAAWRATLGEKVAENKTFGPYRKPFVM